VNPSDTNETMCAILRGDHLPAPVNIDAQRFLDESDYHGVQPLLYHQLKSRNWTTIVPNEVYAELRLQALLETALETLRYRELRIVLAEICDIAPVLLMKGTPLAFSHYPFPSLRTRGDTDLLVTRADLPAIEHCLTQIGYMSPSAVSGELLTSERAFIRQDIQGNSYSMDLHWRINNSPRFAATFSFEELCADSIAIPQLGNQPRALGNVHALMLACIHRISHMYAPYYVSGIPRYGGNRLIWLYDIHLLGEAMTPKEFEKLVDLAQEKQLSAVCADGLAVTRNKFGSTFPAEVVATLARNGKREPIKLPGNNPSQLRGLLEDFRCLSSWRERLLLAREHLFPDPEYMRIKYGNNERYLLPFFYAHRAVRGLYRMTRRQNDKGTR
jgi:hypothetical protein